jgi:hypothetical protein
MNIDPGIVAIVLEVGRAIWDAVSGRTSKDDALAIAEAALHGAVAEAKHRAELLGIEVRSEQLADAASRLLVAMRAAESGGGLPRILEGAAFDYVHVPIEEGGACRNCGAVDLTLPCPGPRL